MTFAEKILFLRKEKGWTQEMLAEKINVSRQALSKWEAGSVLPDTDNVVQLSKLFGVTTDYLLLDEYDNPMVRTTGRKTATESWRPELDMFLYASLSVCLPSAFGVFILGILSSIFPATYIKAEINGPEKVYDGLMGFLMSNNLMWLFWLCIVAFGIGLICCLYFVGMKYKKRDK